MKEKKFFLSKLRGSIERLGQNTSDILTDEERGADVDELKAEARYSHYDSHERSYLEDFHKFIAPHESFEDFLTSKFPEKVGSLIGLELGGPGVNLFSSFPAGFFRKTAGATLHKVKFDKEVANHEVIEADVFLKRELPERSWQQVLDWVEKNGKPNFLVERIMRPLNDLYNPRLFLAILDRWYKILDDEAVAFIQVPSSFLGEINSFNEIRDLVDNLKHKNQNLVFEFAEIHFGGLSISWVLYIERNKNSPKSLGKLFE